MNRNNIIKLFAPVLLINGIVQKEAIRKVFLLAYRDAQRRFIEHKKINKNERVIDKIKREQLVDAFYDYFSNSPMNAEEFDIWHKETCDSFIGENNFVKINYGLAQKIINMMFKYLYCYPGSANENYFIHCHMTLDSYILKQLTGKVVFVKNLVWSKIDDYKIYSKIQKEIRDYYKRNPEIYENENISIPIQIEFIIWEKAVNSK